MDFLNGLRVIEIVYWASAIIGGMLFLFRTALLFIGGGIAPKLGKTFTESSFRARFDRKGRFSDYMASIPVYLITHDNPAMLGLAARAIA